MTVDSEAQARLPRARPARLRRATSRTAHRPLHHRRQGPVAPEARQLPAGCRPATPRPASTTAGTSGRSARRTTARQVNGPPKDPAAGVLQPTGVPVFVTDVRDSTHPYTYATPVDTHAQQRPHRLRAQRRRRPATASPGPPATAACAATGRRQALRPGRRRSTAGATAYDPIPYAGGTTPSVADGHGRPQRVPRDAGPVRPLALDGDDAVRDDVQQVGPALHHAGEHGQLQSTRAAAPPVRLASVAGSYNGEDWASSTTTANKFLITKLGD